jgi:hypothetical protein
LDAILAYCDLIEEYDIDDRLRVVRIIRVLDTVYIKFIAERDASVSRTGGSG